MNGLEQLSAVVLAHLNPAQIAENLPLILALAKDALDADGQLSVDTRLEIQARLDALAQGRL